MGEKEVFNLNAAPISKTDRAQLLRDAANIRATAERKGVTLDRYEESREGQIAKSHFELGCWLYRFTKLRGLPPSQYLQERIGLVMRLFLSGFIHPRYDFFTVFDFGERQFDGIFEEGDAVVVIDGLRQQIPMDSSGQIAKAFECFGWPTAMDAGRPA